MRWLHCGPARCRAQVIHYPCAYPTTGTGVAEGVEEAERAVQDTAQDVENRIRRLFSR